MFLSLKLDNIANFKFFVGQDEKSCNHISQYFSESKSDTKRNSPYQKSHLKSQNLKKNQDIDKHQNIENNVS